MSATAFDKQKNLREELAKTFKPKYREVPTQKWFSQLVNNGTFDTDTSGWIAANSTLSVVANSLRITVAGASGGAYQDIPVTTGRIYNITGSMTAGTGVGEAIIYDNNSFVTRLASTLIYGNFAFNVRTVNPFVRIYLYDSSSTGLYTDFDNISVREAYTLPSNILVTKVFDNGSLLKPNTDYTIVDDGLTKTISFTVEPNVLSDVLVEYWEQI